MLRKLGQWLYWTKLTWTKVFFKIILPIATMTTISIIGGIQKYMETNLKAFLLQIGWAYGSITEDLLTGIRIYSIGWKSKSLILDPPAFLGSAPTGGPASLTQHKRWSTGLLEILLSRSSPILPSLTKQLKFRMCLAWKWLVNNIGSTYFWLENGCASLMSLLSELMQQQNTCQIIKCSRSIVDL